MRPVSKWKVLSPFLSLTKISPAQLPIIILFGVLAALSESIGISFFIPLLEDLNQSNQQVNFFIPQLSHFYNSFSGQTQTLILLALILVAILCKTLFNFGSDILLARYKSKVGHVLRSQIFERLMLAPLSDLEQYQTGHLINVLATESWRVGDACMFFINIITNSLTALVFLSVLVVMSWKLTLLSAIALASISGLLIWLTRSVSGFSQRAVNTNQTLAERMYEGVSGLQEIRLYSNGAVEQKKFEAASQKVRHAFFRLDVMGALVLPLHEMLSVIVIVCILGFSLLGQQLSLPAALAFMFILYRLQPRMRQLDASRLAIASAWGSIQKVSAFLALQPQVIMGQPIETRSLSEMLSFQDVSFVYPGTHHPVLHPMTFSIESGRTTAIIGPSGAGKTTLLKLLSRLYEPTTGQILIGTTPFPDLSPQLWGQQVAVVNQKPHIFQASVRDNIAYAYPEASQTEVEQAARWADADRFIQGLPDGYNTMIGGRDAHLSGGQCQRISLARALIRNPDILILDEPTNALDGISAEHIRQVLQNWGRSKTVIIVAHNFQTIQHADDVLVLERGRLKTSGNFQSLYQDQGDELIQQLLGPKPMGQIS